MIHRAMAQYTPNITKLLQEGAKSYAAKSFETAVDHYGEACQLFSQQHDAAEDPDLLLLYGKALFQLAQSNNGLFGDNPDAKRKEDAGNEDDDSAAAVAKTEGGNGMFTFSEDVPLAEEDDSEEEQNDEQEQQERVEDNEEEEEDEQQQQQDGNQEQEEEEQTDFEVAWEILDLARTLFESKPEDKSDNDTNQKLSDIYDLLGEISLETENFSQASDDFESLLKIRESMYPFESNLVSEAHYKLSLALEFNFCNDKCRERAVHHLERAIDSIKQNQEKSKSDETKDDDLIKDLQIRLDDLKKDPNELLEQQKQEILKGILGEAASSSTATVTPAAATKPVNDLTSIVKKRKAKPSNDTSKRARN